MDARELRIGNYVRRNGLDEIRRVVELTNSTVNHVHYGIPDSEFGLYDDEDFEGIPLTAEWMTRFGFDYHYDAYRRNINKGFPLRMWLTVRVFADSVEVYILHKHGLSIAYVHQLQNLYFALTGEELELETVKEKI